MLTWQRWRQQLPSGACSAWARGSDLAETSVGAWRHVLGLIRPILFRWRRSEQVDSDDGGGELIGAILKAREARGNSAESLTNAWERVAGQMYWILAALCRSLENLHGDMSYVVIGGPMWKIRRSQWSWWRWSSFWRWKFNLGTSDSGGSVRRGHRKGLLTDEVEAEKNTNKDKIARHKKIRAIALIPC